VFVSARDKRASFVWATELSNCGVVQEKKERFEVFCSLLIPFQLKRLKLCFSLFEKVVWSVVWSAKCDLLLRFVEEKQFKVAQLLSFESQLLNFLSLDGYFGIFCIYCSISCPYF
jgi:hypothetical protein